MSDFETISEAVSDFAYQLDVIFNKIIEVKPQFEKVIADKTIPLEDRWNLFVSAPSQMCNHRPFIQHIHIGGREISWYDDFGRDRYEEIDMIDAIEWMEDCFEDWGVDQVNEMKEYILAHNLRSFTNDW